MPQLKTIKLRRSIHRERNVVVIWFEYDLQLIGKLRQVSGARWSQTMKSWYIPENMFDLHVFFESFKEMAYVDYSGLKMENAVVEQPSPPPPVKTNKVDLPKGYLDMLDQKRYSENTKKIYTSYMRDFATMFRKYDLEAITKDQINRYILWLIQEKDISSSQQNQRINAIKFYYEKVLERPGEYYDIDRPRKGRHLPDVLSAC